MAPLTQAEEQALVQQVLHQLAGSPYACSALVKLSGGTANFLYRGDLTQPLPSSAADTVIVKVSTDYVAINRDFPLDVTRCAFENSMLSALDGFPRTISTPSGDALVKVPRIYFFDQEMHIQVLEYFPDTTDLTTVLESPSVNLSLPRSSPTSIGRALGSWLRSFHTWSSEPAQNALLAEVGPNLGMRQLKCLITYDSFIEILERHPETIQGYRDTLQAVKAAMKHEFERLPVEGNATRGLIHGDFWGGNVLLPNGTWRDSQDSNKLFIIDWENIQFGHRAVDVGGILADLYERYHFKGVAASLPAMEGLIQGYGQLSEELAFGAAIHAGVHLICWYYRRDRNAPLPYPLPKILAALTTGRDLILKGWAKDKSGLQNSILASLFADENIIS
ncbi:kinase-like domain-containing protein [Biscogniauxia marginata]|nr:kinase-like domain-containing protein [Biscogniauxia marginata]